MPLRLRPKRPHGPPAGQRPGQSRCSRPAPDAARRAGPPRRTGDGEPGGGRPRGPGGGEEWGGGTNGASWGKGTGGNNGGRPAARGRFGYFHTHIHINIRMFSEHPLSVRIPTSFALNGGIFGNFATLPNFTADFRCAHWFGPGGGPGESTRRVSQPGRVTSFVNPLWPPRYKHLGKLRTKWWWSRTRVCTTSHPHALQHQVRDGASPCVCNSDANMCVGNEKIAFLANFNERPKGCSLKFRGQSPETFSARYASTTV